MGERDCLPCLDEECLKKRSEEEEEKKKKGEEEGEKKEKKKKKDKEKKDTRKITQEGDDFCNICWIDELSAAPCVWLGCGHMFHYECVKEKLDRRWGGAEISFAFADCTICGQMMEHELIEGLFIIFFSYYHSILLNQFTNNPKNR